MAVLPVRKIATAGVLAAVAIVLGITHLGFIPWGPSSLTIMHVPVIVGAILEGPVVGIAIGFIFGAFSMLQSMIAPTGPMDVAFANPLISVLPRLLVGLFAYLVYRAVRGGAEKVGFPRESAAIALSAVAGSATNTVLVLGALGLFKFFPWPLIWTVAAANGIPEAVAATVVAYAVVVAAKRLGGGGRARLAKDEEA